MQRCTRPEEVERALGDDAEPALRAAVLAHAARCGPCRAVLERAREDAALFAELSAASSRAADDGDSEVPGYELTRELHRGGQGVIHLARQRATKRTVALKLLLAGRDASARERYRFEREIELAAGLHHPGIVTIHDSGIAHGIPWYAMEYVEGEHLDQWLRDRRPERRSAVELFLRLTRVVAYAHGRGVVHRDLKPENVLVDDAGEPHVLDFGIARPATATEALRVTLPGEFMGTLAYASPEQIQGRDAEVGTTSDVYSLGVMLHETLTGRLPHDWGGDLSAAVEHLANADPPDPAALAAEVGRELATIVHKALAPEPSRRYASARDLANDLARFLADEPIEARADSITYLLGRAFRRHKIGLGIAASFLVLAGVSLFAFLAEHVRADEQEQAALQMRSVLQDILSAAGPDRMGAEATLLEVLEEASSQVVDSLGGAPDALAAVEYTIGETYWRLRMMDEAEGPLRSALERYRRLERGGGLATARTLHRLGLVLGERSRDEAIEVHEEALALRRRLLGEDHDDVAASVRALGIALAAAYYAPDLERAERLLREAHASFRGRHGDAHVEVAYTAAHLAGLAADRGATDEAAAGFASAIATYDDLAVRDDPRMIECLNAYASVLRTMRRFDAAERMLDRAARLTLELFGARWRPDVLRSYARLHFARGDWESSETMSRRALASELRRWKGQAVDDGPSLLALARRLEETGPGEEAPWLDAFRAVRPYLGEGPYQLASWITGVAQLQVHRGELELAESLGREALTITCRIYGDDCPIRVRSLENLARILVECEERAEAVKLLREAVETRRRVGTLDCESGERSLELLRVLEEEHRG